MSSWHRLVALAAAITLPFGLAACAGGGGGRTASSSETSAASSPAPTAGSSPSSRGEVTLRAYEFPGGMIEGFLGGGKTYTRVEGLLAVPEGAGRHPVVVLVHGSYASCIDPARDKLLPGVATVPWPQGCGTARGDQGDGLTRGPDYVRTPASFAYLAKELAGRGFAVVVPDVNSKERIDWGGEPDARKLQTNLATLHLDLLRRLDTGDSLGLSWGKELTGRLDTGRVGLVRHSSGAGWALAAGLGGEIPGTKAVAAIEPSVRDLTPTGTPPPMLSLLGQCDEQIPLEENRKEMGAIATAAPKTSFLAVILEHATHIGMLTGGGSHEIGLVQPDSSPACAKGALLAPQVQRAAAALLVGDFMQQAFAGSSSFQLHEVTGSTATVEVASNATATMQPGATAPPAVDPAGVTYTRSTTTILPPKPADLTLSQAGGDSV